MKLRIKLLEAYTKKEIDDITKNFVSIKIEPFTKQLQDILLVEKDLFNQIISAPIINDIIAKKDFIKILNTMQTNKNLIYRIKFILLALATGLYKNLSPSYSFHNIDKELPGHFILRLNGDDSIRFKPEVNSVSIRDIASHSKRGY